MAYCWWLPSSACWISSLLSLLSLPHGHWCATTNKYTTGCMPLGLKAVSGILSSARASAFAGGALLPASHSGLHSASNGPGCITLLSSGLLASLRICGCAAATASSAILRALCFAMSPPPLPPLSPYRLLCTCGRGATGLVPRLLSTATRSLMARCLRILPCGCSPIPSRTFSTTTPPYWNFTLH